MTKRRDFIKKSVLGTAGVTIGGLGFSAKSYTSIMGANDRFRIAVCGLNGRGKSHIKLTFNFRKFFSLAMFFRLLVLSGKTIQFISLPNRSR